MSAEKISLDTNILVSAFDSNNEHHSKAVKVMERAVMCDCVLTLQVLGEFFNAITHKKIVPAQKAAELVNNLQSLFPVVHSKPTALKKAIDSVEQNKLSFWEAMLLASAHDAGINMLLTDGFQQHQVLEGVRIINPFASETAWSS